MTSVEYLAMIAKIKADIEAKAKYNGHILSAWREVGVDQFINGYLHCEHCVWHIRVDYANLTEDNVKIYGVPLTYVCPSEDDHEPHA